MNIDPDLDIDKDLATYKDPNLVIVFISSRNHKIPCFSQLMISRPFPSLHFFYKSIILTIEPVDDAFDVISFIESFQEINKSDD